MSISNQHPDDEDIADDDFPDLFSTTKAGKTMVWRTWADGIYSYHQFGELNGKMRDPIAREAKATNVGRKNHKTAEEQALLMCERKWASQLDKGYAPAEDDVEGRQKYIATLEAKRSQRGNNHGISDIVKGDRKASPKNEKDMTVAFIQQEILPMLANKYEEKKDGYLNKRAKIPYLDFGKGVYAQPKLDGIRCIARLQLNEETGEYDTVLTSRTGKQFVFLEHIREHVKEILLHIKHPELVFDGELYFHRDTSLVDQTERFGIITGCCRTVRTKPHPQQHLIQYHVFDLVDTVSSQTTRFAMLRKIFKTVFDTVVILVPWHEVHTQREVDEYHDKFVVDGYEGIIVRDKRLMYVPKHRSSQLLKYKNFKDEEFKIVGAEQGEGNEQGCVVWVCQTSEGKMFKCRPRGSFEIRKVLYEQRDRYMGKLLTVRYQEMSTDNIPRFPAGLAIRNYE